MTYQRVESVVRAIKIMEILRGKSLQNEFLSPSEAARAAGISRVSAYNILNTLEECGYVRHSARGRYEEGAHGAFFVQGHGIVPRLCSAARPLMEKITSSGKDGCVLATLNNGKRVELLRVGKLKNSRSAPFAANAALYAMRTTRVVLAWYNTAQLDFFLRHNGLPSLEDWPEANNTRSGLLRELQKIRACGGCCDLNDQSSLTATAVPVFGEGDEILASLGCYSPRETTDFVRQRGIFNILQDCASAIRRRLADDDAPSPSE